MAKQTRIGYRLGTGKVIYPDIEEDDMIDSTTTTVRIGSRTFFTPFKITDRYDICEMFGVREDFVESIINAPTDDRFMELVKIHARRQPPMGTEGGAKAINSEDGANAKKAAEQERRKRVIEEAHRHDAIEDAESALEQYQARTRIYIAANLFCATGFFIGLCVLTFISLALGLGITVPFAVGTVFTTVATAQRFARNGIADKRKAVKQAQRNLRDFQT